jgi:SNF2 family DNA or RNA helicase
MYDDMERDMFFELKQAAEDEGIEAVNAAGRTLKCLQLASGAVYDNDGVDWHQIHDEKIKALDSIIAEANGSPVLVAYHFRSDLERLQKAFPQGRVLDKDPETLNAWNRGEIPVMFAHPASAGHGLNLADGGNRLVFFSLSWNLEEHLQIIERIGPVRQKQAGYKRPVYLYYIMAENTVDGLVKQRLSKKKSIQEVLLEAMQRHGGGKNDD